MTRDELRALVAEMSEMDLVEIRRLALHELMRRDDARTAMRANTPVQAVSR